MKKLLIQCFIALAAFGYANAQRGRVQIQDGTIVTDRGSLLRGAFVGLDNPWNKMPSRETVSELKNLGLNCIHVYAENPWDEKCTGAGYNVDLIDSLVSWTSQDSLYLIITSAGWVPEVDTFFTEFWSYYPDRYKDETHLIFEIVNEPFGKNPRYDSTTLDMEVRLYDTIRQYAPETHILLMSYSTLENADSNLIGLDKIKAKIDWSNASIAGHGYSNSLETNREFITTLQDSGYAVTITEPPSLTHGWLTVYANLAYTRILENEFVSYTHFLDVNKIIDGPEFFKSRIESSDIRWTPDFGTWPLSIENIQYINPYNPIMGAFYDKGKDIHPFNDTLYLYALQNEGYVAFFNLDFRKGADEFSIECSSVSNSTVIEIHLDSLDGPLVGQCPIQNTHDWYKYMKNSCTLADFEGVHDVYLHFTDSDHWWALGVLTSIVFKEKGVNTYDIGNEGCVSTKYPHDSIAEVYASSEEGSFSAEMAFDGDMNTRWGSDYTDKEWIAVDLGQEKIITGAKLYWENAHAFVYSLQVSNDMENWVTVYSNADCQGGVESISNLAQTGRYVRMLGLFKDTHWGYSLYEMEIYTCETITATISPQKEDENTVQIYPNPASDFLTIASPKNAQLMIYSLQGQLLLKEFLNNDLNTISISQIPTGTYLVKIQTDKNTVCDKLMVK